MKKILLMLGVAVAATIGQAAMFAWSADWEDGAAPDSLALYYVTSESADPLTQGTVVDSFTADDLEGETSISWLSNIPSSAASDGGGFYLVAKDSNDQVIGIGGVDGPAYIPYSDVSSYTVDPSNMNPYDPGSINPSAGGGSGGSYDFGHVAAVPEPASAMLMLCGIGMMVYRRRRQA